jgi:hypothetical protein
MRTLGNNFRTTIESSNSSEVVLLFVTVTHPTLESPIYLNSDIKDYVLNGNTYLGAALTISLLSDQIAAPQAKVSIPNVDRSIGQAVLALTTSPQIKLELYARSDFDSSDPRQAIGTPTVEYSAPFLFLRNVTCDAVGFTADLLSYDLSSEPWPSIRSTKNRLPGLYR